MDLKKNLVYLLICIMFAYKVNSRSPTRLSALANGEKGIGTLKAWPNFNPKSDCEKLNEALKITVPDENAIIGVLGYRNTRQRLEIVKVFNSTFGKDLIKELESKLKGSFLYTCKALCLEPDTYDANEIRRAIKGMGTNEDVLLEILCTRDADEINAISSAYTKEFNKFMVEDIDDDTSGDFQLLMRALVGYWRDSNESPRIDRKKAYREAQDLFKSGELKSGTEEVIFIEVFSQSSFAHLLGVFEEYAKLSKNGIEGAINAEFSGNMRKGLITIVEMVKDTPAYFAKKLQRSMKGLGTDNEALIRIVVSRCEYDMVEIKKSFEQMFGKSLAEWIREDTSGTYTKLLLTLIGEGRNM